MLRIFIKVGNYNPVEVDKARNEEMAKIIIANHEKKDRYEIEVEHYKMPTAWNGKYPVYFIGK